MKARLICIYIGPVALVLPGLAQETYLKLAWQENFEPNVVRYIIYRGEVGSEPVAIDSVVHPNTAYYDYQVEAGQTYIYQIAARNSGGLLSERSLAVNGRIEQADISLEPEGLFGAKISWTTDVLAQSQVVYGTSYPLNQYSEVRQEFSTNHEVLIDFLNPQTTYYFSCLAYDADGNLIASQDSSFVFNADGEAATESVIAYPNPFKGRDHQQVYFDGLLPEVDESLVEVGLTSFWYNLAYLGMCLS